MLSEGVVIRYKTSRTCLIVLLLHQCLVVQWAAPMPYRSFQSS